MGLFLCFIATGAQWDVLQAFAWGRMMSNYSRTAPLTEAITNTLSGPMCSICRMVAEAQKQERTRSEIPVPKLDAKVLLFFQPVPEVVVTAPPAVVWTFADSRAVTRDRAMPPVPPPRMGAV